MVGTYRGTIADIMNVLQDDHGQLTDHLHSKHNTFQATFTAELKT